MTIRELLQSTGGKPTLIKLEKNNCPRCRFLELGLTHANLGLPVKHVKLEEVGREIFDELSISMAPALLLVDQNEILAKHLGPMTATQINQFLEGAKNGQKA